jgi:hypothetical protein
VTRLPDKVSGDRDPKHSGNREERVEGLLGPRRLTSSGGLTRYPGSPGQRRGGSALAKGRAFTAEYEVTRLPDKVSGDRDPEHKNALAEHRACGDGDRESPARPARIEASYTAERSGSKDLVRLVGRRVGEAPSRDRVCEEPRDTPSSLTTPDPSPCVPPPTFDTNVTGPSLMYRSAGIPLGVLRSRHDCVTPSGGARGGSCRRGPPGEGRRSMCHMQVRQRAAGKSWSSTGTRHSPGNARSGPDRRGPPCV